MKRLFVLVAALLLSTMAMAQKSDVQLSLSADFKSSTTFNHDSFIADDLSLVWGCHFNDKWALTIPITATTVKNVTSKKYSDNLFLGLGGEYKFYKGNVADWSVVTRVQSTIGKNAWGGAMTYDFGIMDECENVTTAIGVKYFDARNPHIKDRFCFYLSFGFRLCM